MIVFFLKKLEIVDKLIKRLILKNINLIKTNTSQLKCDYSTFF